MKELSPIEKGKKMKELMDEEPTDIYYLRCFAVDEKDPDVKKLIKSGKIRLSFEQKYGTLKNGMSVKIY